MRVSSESALPQGSFFFTTQQKVALYGFVTEQQQEIVT